MRIVLSERDLAMIRQWYEMAKKRRGPTPGAALAESLGFEEKRTNATKVAAA